MTGKGIIGVFFAAVLCLVAGLPNALAHTVSNSYLTLKADKAGTFTAQWDISLRDLQFVVGLDDNGDGNITWGELRHHRKAIAQFAYARIAFKAGGKACKIHPTKQWVDNHADGAYAALFFTVHCPAKHARELSLRNRLLFKIDPTHRGILVFRDGSDTATALLSPAKHDLKLKLAAKAG
jgi:hypothetical protein